jgi:hypothetical protein
MPSLSYLLRETNGRLGSWLEGLVSPEGNPVIAKPEQLTAILSELLKTGAALRGQPMPQPGTDPELDFQLALYRRHVERLRDLLPSIHSQLLLERACLEGQRARVKAAAEWARASRQTL